MTKLDLITAVTEIIVLQNQSFLRIFDSVFGIIKSELEFVDLDECIRETGGGVLKGVWDGCNLRMIGSNNCRS